MTDRPICPYCNADSELVYGDVIYPHRHDLHHKPFYLCHPCDAYVGCHPGTEDPLGRLADPELRKAKQRAHAAFDPLWKATAERQNTTRNKARRAGYRWLAEQLGIHIDDCHIGMMDVAMCDRVVEICAPYRMDGTVERRT